MRLSTSPDILKHRQSLGLNYQGYAALAGVTHPTVMRWESGENDVPHWLYNYMSHKLKDAVLFTYKTKNGIKKTLCLNDKEKNRFIKIAHHKGWDWTANTQ